MDRDPASIRPRQAPSDNGRLAVRLAFWLAVGAGVLGVGSLIGWLATGSSVFAELGLITLVYLLPAVLILATLLLIVGGRRGVPAARIAVTATLLALNLPLGITCLALGAREHRRSVVTLHNTTATSFTHIVLHHGNQTQPLDDLAAGETRSVSVWWESEGPAWVTARQGEETVQHALTDYTLPGDRLEGTFE